MAWFKVDDGLYDHPKWIDLAPAAQALWLNSGSWAGRNLTDGWVSPTFVRRYPSWSKSAKELVRVTLWHPDAERDGKTGFQFHDWLDYNPSSSSVKAGREADQNRKAVQRDPALKAAVRARDLDCCRYCGIAVRFGDQRSPMGGTYDHVNPKGGTTLPNVVLACRGCNSSKGHRTPAQARMTLLPGPAATESGLNPNSDLSGRTQRVTPSPPKGRDGNGPGSGREGLHAELDPVSWNPADYELADLSTPVTPSPPAGHLEDPWQDVPLPGLDTEPLPDPHEHDEDPR